MLAKATVVMAARTVAMALCCAVTPTAGGTAVAEETLASMVEKLFSTNAVSVQDDGHVVKIEWQGPGADEEEEYCIEGSMVSYMTVMEAVRDKKLDVTGRTLDFTTRMHRRGRDGKDDKIVLLAASWDGSKLMNTDWKASIAGAVDGVNFVQADQNFPTAWALSEVCTSMYGNPRWFCAFAKRSARR